MRRIALLVIAIVLLSGALGVARLMRPRLTAVERGRRVAETHGCFSCHGPEGTKGIPNAGRADGTVPSLGGSLMMYAHGPEEVREWIRDGRTRTKAASATWRAERERGALRMPAFGKRLTARQIDDLVAFVLASAGEPAPDDSLASAGRDRAAELGCFGCHGEGARFARPNPGSFKGYIPSWDGADFPELVRNRAEFEEWVTDGVSQDLRRNPVAQFFLRRAPVHMPAFRKHLQPGDVDAMWAYVTWLRAQAAAATAGDAKPESGSRPG